ncbi:MAG TPA: hypothetical protein VL282_02055 [Tepidisphaeraceae bacterium]|jgi:hypothetical protein|nr:hypothetical protein [Tepidisphaeraceae bacterium]
MIAKLFRKFGSLMCIIAGFVLFAIEYRNYRVDHTISIFWIAIAICMIGIASYELIAKRKDDSRLH